MLQRRADVPGGSKHGDQDAYNLENFPGAKAAAVLWDEGTDWLDVLPRFARTTDESKRALQQFRGSEPIHSF